MTRQNLKNKIFEKHVETNKTVLPLSFVLGAVLTLHFALCYIFQPRGGGGYSLVGLNGEGPTERAIFFQASGT